MNLKIKINSQDSKNNLVTLLKNIIHLLVKYNLIFLMLLLIIGKK